LCLDLEDGTSVFETTFYDADTKEILSVSLSEINAQPCDPGDEFEDCDEDDPCDPCTDPAVKLGPNVVMEIYGEVS